MASSPCVAVLLIVAYFSGYCHSTSVQVSSVSGRLDAMKDEFVRVEVAGYQIETDSTLFKNCAIQQNSVEAEFLELSNLQGGSATAAAIRALDISTRYVPTDEMEWALRPDWKYVEGGDYKNVFDCAELAIKMAGVKMWRFKGSNGWIFSRQHCDYAATAYDINVTPLPDDSKNEAVFIIN